MSKALPLICLMASPWLIGGAAFALPATVTVGVQAHEPSDPRIEARILARAAAGPDDKPKPDEIGIRLSAPGEALLELPPGTAWTVAAHAERFWGAEKTVLVTEEDTHVPLKLWRAGILRARVHVGKGEEIPSSVTLRFESSPKPVPATKTGEGSGWEVPRATIECPLREGVLNCQVPAATLDVKLRAQDFISHYWWDIELRAGETTDLGDVALRRGASLVGWVETADGSDLEKCALVLMPRSAEPAKGRKLEKQLRRQSLTAEANKRGFFHFQEIPPGSYLLVARSEGFVEARRSISQVYEDFEANLRDSLVLHRPASIEVFLNPALDPSGRPWHLVLADARFLPAMEMVGQGAASLAGWWEGRGLAPGRHHLTVLDQDGHQWLQRIVEVEPGHSSMPLDISLVAVRGSVRLGKEPLQAVLRFSDGPSLGTAQFESDDDGLFSGHLAGEGTWQVKVEAELPPVVRVLPDIEVTRSSSAEAASVDIVLPDTELRGKVVDEAGEAVSPALVNVTSLNVREHRVQSFVDDDSLFHFYGLPEGTVVVDAQAPGPLVSGQIVVKLSEGHERPPLEVVVREVLALRGQVIHSGRGVPGARVRAVTLPDFYVDWPSVLTDATGGFELNLPPGTREAMLSVAAPGFALRMLRRPVDVKDQLIVELSQLGGTIRVDVGADESRQWGLSETVLLHEGSYVSFHQLISWAMLNGGYPEDSHELAVSMMEPGEYTVCSGSRTQIWRWLSEVVPGSDCASGVLPPLGELELEIPRRSDARSTEKR